MAEARVIARQVAVQGLLLLVLVVVLVLAVVLLLLLPLPLLVLPPPLILHVHGALWRPLRRRENRGTTSPGEG